MLHNVFYTKTSQTQRFGKTCAFYHFLSILKFKGYIFTKNDHLGIWEALYTTNLWVWPTSYQYKYVGGHHQGGNPSHVNWIYIIGVENAHVIAKVHNYTLYLDMTITKNTGHIYPLCESEYFGILSAIENRRTELTLAD